MKKIYTLLLLSALAYSAKSQYTITSASNPVAGDVESYRNLDSTGLFHGSAGTGQTWNYSAIVINTVAATTSTYVAMSSVPNSFMFPGATIASGNGTGYYTVYSNNATKIEMIGQAAPTTSGSTLYSNPLKLYSLPFSYGTVSPDNFSFSGTGYTVTGTFTTTGDGTGTLILPTGTYPNVLKQRYLINESITTGTTVNTYTAIESRYYSATSKFPLLIVDTQTSTTSGTTTVYYGKSGQINGALVTSITEQNENSSGLLVYPNPSNGGNVQLLLNMEQTKNCVITVYNSIGQRIKCYDLGNLPQGIQTKSIDVSELERGIYYLKLKGTKNELYKKLIIE